MARAVAAWALAGVPLSCTVLTQAMGKQNLRKTTGPDGREYWVDQHDIVHGVVRTGKPREDAQQYAERSKAEKLLAHWGWPPDSKIERPGGARYDYDCVHPVTGERAAVEIKLAAAPGHAMTELHSTGSTKFTIRDFLAVPAERLAKANDQLKHAPSGVRRCVLLVLEYEPAGDTSPVLSWWHLLAKAVCDLDLELYSNVDEVWLTTAHLTRFIQRRRRKMRVV